VTSPLSASIGWCADNCPRTLPLDSNVYTDRRIIMSVSFRVVGLLEEPFDELFELEDEQLERRGLRRITVDAKPGYPCRVSLADAEVGEDVILTPYAHHDVDTPYRGSGPIFVRQGAHTAKPAVDEIPEFLEARAISVRAYNGDGMMLAANVAENGELREVIQRLLEIDGVAYLHLHNAGPGCFNCRVERTRGVEP
jgi:hypothetical protein